MARESHYQRQGMAKWIEESRHADPKREGGGIGQRNELDRNAKRSNNGSVEPDVPQRFLVCFSLFCGGHICKNYQTYFDGELELFWLLKSEPYLLKFGRDRCETECLHCRFLPGLDLTCSFVAFRLGFCSAITVTLHPVRLHIATAMRDTPTMGIA